MRAQHCRDDVIDAESRSGGGVANGKTTDVGPDVRV